MNINSTYSQQQFFAVQETQRTHTGAASSSPRVDTLFAQEIAKATMESAQASLGVSDGRIYDCNTQKYLSDEEAKNLWELAKAQNAASVAEARKQGFICDDLLSGDAPTNTMLTEVIDTLCPPKIISPHGLLIYGTLNPATGEHVRTSQEARDYGETLLKTYFSVVQDMGLTYAKQASASPEQTQDVINEVRRRMMEDERINSLMQQLGIQTG